ncbi:MAG: lipocalin-like domain-containing protein [Acidobacteriota bacterium]|nr:lipocalin-like domain-containing protein [Acidobacteriota bacterium]
MLDRLASSCLALLFTFGTAACSPPTGDSARDRIVGSWELQSRAVRRSNGEVVLDPVLGQQPIGRLFYDASGHMALQMMRQARTEAISQPATPEEAANPRIVLGYDAYFGAFTLDEAAGTVTHHVEGSLFPGDLGKDFTRQFRLDGDTFELSFVSGTGDSAIARVLVFQRSR